MTKDQKIDQESGYELDEWLEDLKKYEIVYTKGDVENGAIPVGQSCGLIDSIMNVGDIITDFTSKAEELLKNVSSRIS